MLALCRLRFAQLDSERLYAAILCGDVYVNGVRERNPQQSFSSDVTITLESSGHRPSRAYVSRGGEKLEAALQAFELSPAGCCVIDAGASTGGFTDCLLQHGAQCVHAVDVGYNQLAYELRSDPRVVVHERLNIKSVTTLEPAADFAVADLSFRSLCGVAGHLLSLSTRGLLVALLKPQFERESQLSRTTQDQSREEKALDVAGFDGVITDVNEIVRIALGTISALEREQAYTCGVCISPIKGRSGNQELFLLLENSPAKRLSSVEAELRTLLGIV
ncbi:MAG: TlyA family RNA methyltransferase [Spirochaetaceae bacterium]|nr:MAG: TlyA family RNA methyltransferase [Spirochaetaceae bacterium]